MAAWQDEQRYDVLAFGETMVRLATPGQRRLEDTATLELSIGGTESNLAIALARLGRRAAWLSALPDNPLGRTIESTIRKHGVDTSEVIWLDEGRAGLYFIEPGSPPRPTRVIYDRAGSTVAELDPGKVDARATSETRLFHLTGITPALSANCARICNDLAAAAVGYGTPVSLDVNYRSLLWPPDAARAGLDPLLKQASIIFCGAGDARTIWGLSGGGAEVAAGLLERSSAELVVVTDGDAGMTARTRSGDVYHQPAFPVEVIDPVGAGDAFAAGFLHRWFADPADIPTALRSGAAMACLKMTIPGDLALVTAGELDEMLLAMEAGGREIIR